MALGVAVASGLVVPPSASADQVSNLQAEAQQIAAKIQSLGQQEDALSEQFDAAEQKVQTLQSEVSQAQHSLQQAQASANAARRSLEEDALQAYMDGGQSPLATGGNVMANANESLLRAEYENTLATDQTNALDQFHLASLNEQTAKTNFEHQTSLAQAQLRTVQSARQAAAKAQSQLVSTEQQVKGQLAQAVAEQQAEEQAAEQRAAQARLAQEQAQAAAAQAQEQLVSASSGSDPSPQSTYVPPSNGSIAQKAVAAALSRVGDPYVWGASGPSSFDCSGLVMWAYARAGVSLPHYSGSQYDDTVHIPMSDLQPGDLVFFSNPGEHVAMYIGGGQIVEAPYTGADVHVVPLYSEFVLASRVE